MKPDYSTRQLNRLRRRILRVYGTARKEMQDQLTEFLDHFEQLDAHKRELLAAGKITKADYQTWLRNQVFQSELMQQKLDNITQTCTTAQQTAYKLARDEQYDIFALGANWAFYELEQAAGVAFNLTLYNTEAVKRLLVENPKLVPNKRIKSESNKTYDARVFNRYVTKGIIQGKSVHDIAVQAVQGMADTEVHWAMNNAITALTGAQNAGTMQQLRNAQALGIEVQKRWNSTLDYRTREMHRLLDQETADLDEPFKVQGYEIQYPGDPNAAPEMVYHCRCKVTSFLPKYPRRNASRRDNITGEIVPEQSYEEWYEGKKKQYSDTLNGVVIPSSESVGQIPRIKLAGMTDAQAISLQNAHKSVLQTVLNSKTPDHEAGCFILDDYAGTAPFISSHRGSIDFPETPIHAIGTIHSHPTGYMFSLRDVTTFASDGDLSIMTVVGNNGKVYVLQKTDLFDVSGYIGYLKEQLRLYPDFQDSIDKYVAFMEGVLNGAKEYGFEYSSY